VNGQIDNTSSIGGVITGAAGWLVALATLTMTLFLLAIPGIVLPVAAVVPLAVAVALLVAAAAVRGLRRRALHSPSGE